MRSNGTSSAFGQALADLARQLRRSSSALILPMFFTATKAAGAGLPRERHLQARNEGRSSPSVPACRSARRRASTAPPSNAVAAVRRRSGGREHLDERHALSASDRLQEGRPGRRAHRASDRGRCRGGRRRRTVASEKRSASVLAQPSCMNGPRAADADQRRHLERPPVPTSTVGLFVNRAPEWQRGAGAARRVVEQRAAARRPRSGSAARRAATRGWLSIQSAARRSGRSPASVPTCGRRTRRSSGASMSASSPSQWNGSVPRRPACSDCVRRGALAGEVPDAAVVIALGVARRAREVAARVGVEDQVAGVGAAGRSTA